MTGLFLHCRAGFEAECAAEIEKLAAAQGMSGRSHVTRGTAHVFFETGGPDAAAELHRRISFSDLIFTRQWFVAAALCRDLPPGDRAAALVRPLAGGLPRPAGEVFLETPDTNAGKVLSVLCRRLQRPLEGALSAAGQWTASAAPTVRVHACLLDGTVAYIGWCDPHNASPWPMGIPRLRFPRGAPSRATLKLEEALWHFVGDRRERLLRPGMTAVDLGAAPGGWTWQLVQRRLRVAAVDNGSLAPGLLQSGLVTHVRGDGFRYRPTRRVDWMVCDIVEQPTRIADLAAAWLSDGLCRHTVFNLKLPMKRRYETVMQCLERVRTPLEHTAAAYRLACRQLYHDREEVTVYGSRGPD